MSTGLVFLLCGIVASSAQGEVTVEMDKPYQRVKLSHTALLKCCYSTKKDSVQITWLRQRRTSNRTLGPSLVNAAELGDTQGIIGDMIVSGVLCGTLTLSSVQLNDSGLYRCLLNNTVSFLFTHGTYLQVYKPLEKTINLSEKTKNQILIAEGILLLLFVLVPSTMLLLKSKQLKELDKKKAKREEENIYQGLNLDDCCTTYDRIECFKGPGPYEDVGYSMEEEEEIQLEKP
ncbi:B-cell antigen receptor complex-associated protein alpha chain [Aulostomus maculatus]